MKEFSWKTICTGLFDLVKQVLCGSRQPEVRGYRVISIENYCYLAFDGKPSPERMRFVANAEQAYIFSDEIDAFPYILSLHCRFVFEPVIQKAF